MMAVANRGSAKIITPAADWMRWAQVREPDDEEEGILDLAVQPDDSGEAAEHFALAALAQHRNVGAAFGLGVGAGRKGRFMMPPPPIEGLAVCRAVRRGASAGTARH